METRFIDWVMLVVEALILAFIVVEFAWKINDWRTAKKEKLEYENDMQKRLSLLYPEERDMLKALILNAKQPAGDPIAMSTFYKVHGVLIRDQVLGWGIAVEHRRYMKDWAEGKH